VLPAHPVRSERRSGVPLAGTEHAYDVTAWSPGAARRDVPICAPGDAPVEKGSGRWSVQHVLLGDGEPG